MVDLAQAHAALVRDGSFQLGFPAPAPAPAPTVPSLPELPVGGDGTVLFAVVAAVALLATLLVVWRTRRRRNAAGTPAPARHTAKAAGQGADAGEHAEAEALAAAGRHAEAVHALLLRTLARMRTRLPEVVGTAETSRDIAASPALPVPMRTPFARLAAATERGIFARRPVDAAEWEACRALTATLAESG